MNIYRCPRCDGRCIGKPGLLECLSCSWSMKGERDRKAAEKIVEGERENGRPISVDRGHGIRR